MSIKFVHLAFIIICTLFSFFVGIWEVMAYTENSGGEHLGVGVFFVLLGIGLAIYGAHFFKKWRKAGFFL